MPAAQPTISDVERITALDDPVLRNLQITQCYHELSLVMAQLTGGSPNWCTFATWASKQAGQTIRKEDLARALEASLRTEPAPRQVAYNMQGAAQRLGVNLGIEEILVLLWKAYDPLAAFDRSSAAVARGNLKVFAEIGREFARFYVECLLAPLFDAASVERFTAQLRPGGPPDGQDYLRQAFFHYFQALNEKDEKARAELLLLANLQIGYHEQVRLQPEINEALNAPILPPEVFANNLLKLVFPKGDGGWWIRLGWFALRRLGLLKELDAAIQVFVSGAQRQVQFIITKTMMTIELAHAHRLQLGDDLTDSFPPTLEHVSNLDLRELLTLIDPTPDSTGQSGADYWGDFPDRIHFIADMFRCYALTTRLQEPPFDPEQTAALKQGRLPPGRL